MEPKLAVLSETCVEIRTKDDKPILKIENGAAAAIATFYHALWRYNRRRAADYLAGVVDGVMHVPLTDTVTITDESPKPEQEQSPCTQATELKALPTSAPPTT